MKISISILCRILFTPSPYRVETLSPLVSTLAITSIVPTWLRRRRQTLRTKPWLVMLVLWRSLLVVRGWRPTLSLLVLHMLRLLLLRLMTVWSNILVLRDLSY